jgi:DMSO/TMAO reductase YedYZ heme-binding membrane subunit
VASTRSRSSGREHARPSTGGVAAEHATKIYTVAVIGIVVVVAFLALTSIGHVVDAATQHFMLFYAGVFALIALCASVGLGLIATDRMFLNAGRRVFIQSAHRAASFGAVTFLIIHIVTEILAQRVHVIDAVIPFLSPFRTFYIGLGTIASDLIILLVITGILRGRFNAGGKAWRWRAIHYTSYLCFIFGIWHGLLAGRPAKPYVDWSYGFVIAFVLLGLAVRVLSNSLKPKENLSAPPVGESASLASAPLRAAAMFAQAGALRGGRSGATTGDQPVLSAPLSAPVMTALPAGDAAYEQQGYEQQGQPYYEPGYEGPPRYLGAPRSTTTGPQPRPSTGPFPRAATGPQPRPSTGPFPRTATGPIPRAGTGPIPRAATGPQPRPATGPIPRAGTGPFPRPATGPMPRAASGPMPRAATGPFPAAGPGPVPPYVSGPRPRNPDLSGPMPRIPNGPWSAADTGSLPPYLSGPMPRVPNDSWPVADTGSLPPYASGPMPRVPNGSWSAADTGSLPPYASGPMPRVPNRPRPADTGSWPPYVSGPMPRVTGSRPPYGGRQDPVADTGQHSWPGTGPGPWAGEGYQADWESGPVPRVAADPRRYGRTGPIPQAGGTMPPGGRSGTGGWPARSEWPYTGGDGDPYPSEPPWDSGLPGADPDLRFREPGPGMPGYRGSRDNRYGGDRR